MRHNQEGLGVCTVVYYRKYKLPEAIHEILIAPFPSAKQLKLAERAIKRNGTGKRIRS